MPPKYQNVFIFLTWRCSINTISVNCREIKKMYLYSHRNRNEKLTRSSLLFLFPKLFRIFLFADNVHNCLYRLSSQICISYIQLIKHFVKWTINLRNDSLCNSWNKNGYDLLIFVPEEKHKTWSPQNNMFFGVRFLFRVSWSLVFKSLTLYQIYMVCFW